MHGRGTGVSALLERSASLCWRVQGRFGLVRRALRAAVAVIIGGGMAITFVQPGTAEAAYGGSGAGGAPASCSTELSSTLQVQPAVADDAMDKVMTSYGNSGLGWSGSDGGDSVNLPGGRTVWLYDDTYLGLPVNGRRGFVHNSMVVQQGDKFTTLDNEFHGQPYEYMNYGLSPESADWYWSYGGVVSGDTLYVVYGEYHWQGTPGPYNYVQTATLLVGFNLQTLRLETVTHLSLARGILWGVWMINFGAYTYVYGNGPNANELVGYNNMYVARVPVGHLSSTGSWQYFDGTGYETGEANATSASTEAQAQFSVTLVGNVYVLTTMADVFQDPELMLYFGCSPQGPFDSDNGYAIYDTLGHGGPYGTQGIDGVYTYGACAHVGLSSVAGRLVVSYDVNSSNWSLLETNLNIVRPRYVETTITL